MLNISTANLLSAYAFALGAVVGSFLNVLIYRYPRGESIVSPRSRCPRCATPIRWFDNVPIFSWILLAGRCRSCRQPISIRYPLIELASALFYLAIFLRTGVSWGFIPLAILVPMLISLIYIDLDVQILPDVIDKPGIVAGLFIGALELGIFHPAMTLSMSLIDSLIGAAAGGGIIWGIAAAYKLVRKVEGMGQGDVKMMAMIGAIVGWRPLFPLLFLASLTGAAVGIAVSFRHEKGLQVAIPFGVFLGLSTLAVMFFGPTLYEWYLSMLLR